MQRVAGSTIFPLSLRASTFTDFQLQRLTTSQRFSQLLFRSLETAIMFSTFQTFSLSSFLSHVYSPTVKVMVYRFLQTLLPTGFFNLPYLQRLRLAICFHLFYFKLHAPFHA